MLPRGFRNNNPGNLVITSSDWKGKLPIAQNTDGHFEQFSQLFWGVRAMLIDIVGDIAQDGKDTLNKLIAEYAPSFENNTSAYIDYVSRKTGLKPGEKISLDKKTLSKLIRAKIEVENGKQYADLYYKEADFEKAFNELPVSTLALIGINTHKLPVLLVVSAIVLVWLITYKLIKK
ncbi:MAG: structural protein [Thalassobius sp.]|nr:structural protein [Thalassovita sp.]